MISNVDVSRILMYLSEGFAMVAEILDPEIKKGKK